MYKTPHEGKNENGGNVLHSPVSVKDWHGFSRISSLDSLKVPSDVPRQSAHKSTNPSCRLLLTGLSKRCSSPSVQGSKISSNRNGTVLSSGREHGIHLTQAEA